MNKDHIEERMVRPNELRIGNYILLDTGFTLPQWHEVMAQDIADIYNGKITLASIEPIPLSPSILQKCGFENIYGETWSNGNVEILGRMPHFKDGYLLLNGEARTHWACNYYYVHQLQNLYYSLTQTELKIQL